MAGGSSSASSDNSQMKELLKNALLVAVGVGIATLLQRLTAPKPTAYVPQPQPSPHPATPAPASRAGAGPSPPPALEVERASTSAADEQQFEGSTTSPHYPAPPSSTRSQRGGSMRRGDSHGGATGSGSGLHARHTPVPHNGGESLSNSMLRGENSLRGDANISHADETFYGDRDLDELENMIERSNRIRDVKQRLLKRIGPLKGAPPDVLDFLVDNMQLDTMDAQQELCVQGDYGDCMYIIGFGKAEVRVTTRSGESKVVQVLRDGDFFGEAAALQGCLRVATVVMLSRTQYFAITREVLMECVAMWPQLKVEFEKLILQRKAERKYSIEERRKPDVQRRIRDEVKSEMETLAAHSRKGLAWKKNRRIGGGAYGDVYSAIDVRTGEPLAVKTITIGEISDAMLVSLERESEIMERLHHPNLVRGYGMQREADTGKIHIIMELVPLGSLAKLISEFGCVSEAAARTYMAQMLHGLQYLHSEGILHRDIKPANALISADGSIKLADFGISRLGLSHQTQTISGTPAYLSPDAINGKYSVGSDIWALGCTLLELVTAEQPWAYLGLESSTQIIFAIATSPEPYPLPEQLSAELKDLLRKMMCLDPQGRGDCTQLLRHAWFSVPEEELPTLPSQSNEAVGADGDETGEAPYACPTSQLTSFLVALQRTEESSREMRAESQQSPSSNGDA